MTDHDDEDDILDQPVPEWPSAGKRANGAEPAGEPVAAAEDADPDLSDDDLAILDTAEQELVAELRDDLLRSRAELVNYRNRVERDRQANREAAITEVLRVVLPALDDLDRAEAHGDVAEGTPMAMISAKLRSSLLRFGLTPFGAVGDPFDPAHHEAIFQQPSADAQTETVLDVVEVGYRFGDRVVRPAKVAVAVPIRD